MDRAADLRIPVAFGRMKGDAADAWLVEDGADMPPSGYAVRFALPPRKPGVAGQGHAIGCACCSLRGPAADALTRMFHARATGIAPFFRQVTVLASAAGEALVREALDRDAVTRSRYRRAADQD